MTIATSKISTGFAVFFPFELRDSFKSVFPSAKWDSVNRRWAVGPKSGSRLDAWVAEASAAADALAARDEAELTDQELAKVRAELARVEAEAHIAAARHVEATAARVEIDGLRSQIAAAAGKRDAELKAAAVERKAAADAAYSIISADGVFRAFGEMETACGSWPKSYARTGFEAAQAELRGMIEALAAVGLASPEISDAAGRSWNRVDRDGKFRAPQATFRAA